MSSDKVEICRAFGIDTKNLMSATIKISSTELTTVTAQYYVGKVDADELKKELRHYRLEEVKE